MTGILGTLDIVFWGVLTFSILVVLHEGGHFLAARAFGVKVHEFMIGLPGPALRLRTKNMDWGITAIPLGGYVRIAGMEPGPEDELLGPALDAVVRAGRLHLNALAAELGVDVARAAQVVTALEDWGALTEPEDDVVVLTESLDGTLTGTALLDAARKRTYRGLSTWKRLVVLSAGVVVNLLTAIAVFTVVLSAWGTYEPSTVLEAVNPTSPAAEAGLLPGDKLVSFDGTPVESWLDFLELMAATDAGDTVAIGVERSGVSFTYDAVLAERDGHGFLGIGPTFAKVEYSVPQAIGQGFVWTGEVFKAIGEFFRPATFSRSVQNARGVVGISIMAADAAKAGPLDYAWLIALLSLSLGAMNILPIPPLDGGKVAVEVIERVAGRPLGRRFSIAVSAAGAVLLFSLIGYIMYADVMRLAQ
jgi:regulator of sigma E protease